MNLELLIPRHLRPVGLFALAVAAFLLLLFATFWPAISGPFIFDDFANLNALAALNNGISWEALRQYLIQANAGPSGRPLSMLSFLLDDVAWPSQPEPFKYNNLMIHALNSMMLLWLTRSLLMRCFPERGVSNNWLAVLLVAFWALNPYQMSAVMYAVQRMALLSTLFVLWGLIIYISGRDLMTRGRPVAGLLVVWLAYLVAGLLGGLAKENAILFVLFVPLFEIALFGFRPAVGRPWLLKLTIVLPVVLFVLLLIYLWPSHRSDYALLRDFTVGERLLSEGRALGYYLWRYLLPGVGYTGIYADGFSKSTGWLEPWTTTPWWLFHLGLMATALTLRRRMPLLFLSVGFFYTAHFLESGYVPLELFFEHRNYLPSTLLLLGLAYVPRQKHVLVGLLALVLVCAGLNRLQAGFWSKEHDVLAIMMTENPNSDRAVLSFAQYVQQRFGHEAALEIMEPYSRRPDAGLEFWLSWMHTRCQLSLDTRQDVEGMMASIGRRSIKPPFIFERARDLGLSVSGEKCATLTFDDLYALVDTAYGAFPDDPVIRQNHAVALAQLELLEGDYPGYRTQVYQALDAYRGNMELTLSACGYFESLSMPDEACRCYQQYWPGEGKLPDMFRSKLRYLLGRDDLVRQQFVDGRDRTCSVEDQETVNDASEDSRPDGHHSGKE